MFISKTCGQSGPLVYLVSEAGIVLHGQKAELCDPQSLQHLLSSPFQ